MYIRSYYMQFPAEGNVVIGNDWSVVPVKSNDTNNGNYLTIAVMSQNSWHLKSLAIQLFVEKLVEADNKENIKAMHYWTFVKGIHS